MRAHLKMVIPGAILILSSGCVQHPQQPQQGQPVSHYFLNYQPLPTDPPEVVAELTAAQADLEAAGAALRMGDRIGASKLGQKANAEWQHAAVLRAKLVPVNYAEKLRSLREIDAGTALPGPGFNLVDVREQIGEFYENGSGVPQDYAVARGWYQKAINTPGAGFEVTKAKMKLANLYEKGLGGPRDHAKAEQLINSTGVVTEEAKAAQDRQRAATVGAILGAMSRPGPSQAPSTDPPACHTFTYQDGLPVGWRPWC